MITIDCKYVSSLEQGAFFKNEPDKALNVFHDQGRRSRVKLGHFDFNGNRSSELGILYHLMGEFAPLHHFRILFLYHGFCNGLKPSRILDEMQKLRDEKLELNNEKLRLIAEVEALSKEIPNLEQALKDAQSNLEDEIGSNIPNKKAKKPTNKISEAVTALKKCLRAKSAKEKRIKEYIKKRVDKIDELEALLRSDAKAFGEREKRDKEWFCGIDLDEQIKKSINVIGCARKTESDNEEKYRLRCLQFIKQSSNIDKEQLSMMHSISINRHDILSPSCKHDLRVMEKNRNSKLSDQTNCDTGAALQVKPKADILLPVINKYFGKNYSAFSLTHLHWLAKDISSKAMRFLKNADKIEIYTINEFVSRAESCITELTEQLNKIGSKAPAFIAKKRKDEISKIDSEIHKCIPDDTLSSLKTLCCYSVATTKGLEEKFLEGNKFTRISQVKAAPASHQVIEGSFRLVIRSDREGEEKKRHEEFIYQRLLGSGVQLFKNGKRGISHVQKINYLREL